MKFCIDREKLLVTKGDCSCVPHDIDCHEFVNDTDNKEELLSKAKAIMFKDNITFCEHI